MSFEDAQGAHTYWKDTYVADCGTAGKRVNSGEADTLAEAIGFEALLAVGWDDKETFDSIATYYRKAGKASDALKSTTLGLMELGHGPRRLRVRVVYPGSTIGADINVAMALLQAECRWGGGDYIATAEKILEPVREAATKEVDGKTVLLPSDGIGADSDCSSPSYMAPGFFRVFAKAFPDDAKFWNGFADDSYAIINAASKTVTKLAAGLGGEQLEGLPDGGRLRRLRRDPDWLARRHRLRLVRHGSRQEVDARLDGYLEDEVGTDQFMNVKDGFFADGEGMLIALGLGNSAFVGAFAVASMATSQEISDSFHEALVDIPKANDKSYYSDTGRAIYLMLSANKFSPGCY